MVSNTVEAAIEQPCSHSEAGDLSTNSPMESQQSNLKCSSAASSSPTDQATSTEPAVRNGDVSVDEWCFPPMTVAQLAKLLQNDDVRGALVELNPSFIDIFTGHQINRKFNEGDGKHDNDSMRDSMPMQLSKYGSHTNRVATSLPDPVAKSSRNLGGTVFPNASYGQPMPTDPSDTQIDIYKNGADSSSRELLRYEQRPLMPVTECALVEPREPRYTLKALGEYDMVEIKILCDSFAAKDVGVCRILVIHSGITLYNLHRCITIALNIEKRAAEEYLHAWIVNDGTVYGGGRSCTPAMSRRLSLQTDRHTTYRQLVQLPIDDQGRIHKQRCAALTYIFGKLQCQVQLNDFLLQRTNSADLLWVPRCCTGSYGSTPSFGNWMNFKALETHYPEFEVDLDAVNLSLMETRFSKNVASCRRTKRKRMEGVDEIVLRSYRCPMHEFFADRSLIQKLSTYVNRQASQSQNPQSKHAALPANSHDCPASAEEASFNVRYSIPLIAS